MICHYESEQSILGAMLRSKSATERAIEKIRPEDFAIPEFREIYDAMMTLALNSRNVDLTTVDAELTRRGKLDTIGGASKLIEIAQSVPSAANIDAYIDIVIEKANMRRLQAIAESINRKTKAEELKADQIIELIDRACNDITTRAIENDKGWISGTDAVIWAYEAAEKSEKHIPTGFDELDNMLCGGLVSPELTIVGARPGKGKSAFLLTAALNAARAGYKVGYCSLEMSALQLGQRILAALSKVSITRQRTGALDGSDWEMMCMAVDEMGIGGIKDRLRFYEGYNLTVEKLANIARHAVRRKEMDLLVIDYIQLLRTNEKMNSDFERLGTVSKTLKQLALALNIPILTAAQVRRQSQDDSKKGGRAPTLDELRGSGDLEQDADNVFLIHVPENEDDATLKHIKPEHYGIWDRAMNAAAVPYTLEIAKQRQGPTGRTWCLFKPMNMRFYPDVTRVNAANNNT